MDQPDPISAPPDFRRRKLELTLWIMGVGMAIALAWAAVQGWVLGRGYPFNTFLFNPRFRFTDLANTIVISKFANPYLDPSAMYPPFAWLCLRALSILPNSIDLVLVFFTSLAVLLVVVAGVLRPVVPQPVPRILCCLLLIGTAYPVIFCFDRGNIEIVLAALIGAAISFLSRARYLPALLCLVPAISLKLYPVLLLVLLVRQRQISLAFYGLLATVAIALLSLPLLSLPVQTTWKLYRQDVAVYTNFDVYENAMLENSASPWNAFKLVLLTAGKVGLLDPVQFDHHDPFLRHAYTIYAAGGFLLSAVLAVEVCLVEKEFLRCAAALLLLMSMSAPAGGDYRLLHDGVALVCLIMLRTRRTHDQLAVILLALIMIPKREVILTFAGLSESGFADVSAHVFLDPILALAALLLLVYDCPFHAGWSRLRARGLIWALLPGFLRRSLPPTALHVI